MSTFTPPPGFEPVFYYPDGNTPVAQEGLGRIKRPGMSRELDFDLSDKTPKLPLKAAGKLWHTGWDIPILYAIDADNQCWMDNAHGHALRPVTASMLIGGAETETEQNDIRRVLGLELPWPSWALAAKAAGWTPPAGWVPPK
jgi:hypothetical protein